jgi:hypothetical protein
MRIKPSTRIHAMLRIHPQLEEVLEDHDLDVDAINSKSIRQACGDADLEVEIVLEDLKASLRDSATEGWLSVEEDDEGDYDDEEEDYDDEDEDEDEDDYYEDSTPVADDEDDDWD